MEEVDSAVLGGGGSERQALARLLGRGIGFLQATARTGISPAQLKAGREAILAKLGPDEDAFLVGEQMIAGEIGAVDEKLAAIGETQRASAASKQEEHSEKKRAVGKAVAEVDYQILKNQTDSATQIRSSDWEIEQLQKQLAKSQFELNMLDMALVRQQAELQKTIGWLQQADQDRASGKLVDESAVGRNNLSIPPANNMLKQLGEQRLIVSQQVAEAQAKLQAAMLRRGGLAENENQATAELETKSQKLKHDEKKLAYARKQAQKTAAASGARRALTEQRRAFSSFEPFHFDDESDRLLASYSK